MPYYCARRLAFFGSLTFLRLETRKMYRGGCMCACVYWTNRGFGPFGRERGKRRRLDARPEIDVHNDGEDDVESGFQSSPQGPLS